MTDELNRPRAQLYRQLTAVTHRDYGPMVMAFREAFEGDPDFIAHACVHVVGNSKIRDQQNCAVITLLQSPPIYGYRQSGRALLLGSDVYETEPGGIRGLAPYRIFRVLNYIRGSDRKTPRQVRTLARDYYGMLERSRVRADGVVLGNRKVVKAAWKSCHFRSADFPYLHALLFEEPPEDSKLGALKRIANSKSPREQMELVQRYKIGYRVLQSVLPDTPVAKLILIQAMSPTEALNARSWVERSGMLNIPEVLEAYIAKVAKATRSVASADHRVSAQGTDERVQAAVQVAKETSVRESKRIERPTLLMVDISSSMHNAIEVAKKFGSRIAPLCDDLMITLFNSVGRVLRVEGTTLADFERAFLPIRANGMTCVRASLDVALDAGFEPEQIVVITDEGENQGDFACAVSEMSEIPHVAILNLPSDDRRRHDIVACRLRAAGVRFDRFELSGEDYFLYDQVAALLGGPAATPLAEQILAVAMPKILGLVI